MEHRNLKRTISVVLAIVMVLGIIPATVFAKTPGNDGSAEMNEAYANRESLMPIGPSFNVDTILEWSPESDPDAAYSRASVKLADRVGGYVVNPVANPEAKLMLCSLANSDHDHTSSQGIENFLSWSFNYWQYADSFVYWSGSQEGLFVCPTGEFTDAAHTNGVPVVATLGFPWGSGSGYVEQVQKFVQKAKDGSFPVADKMIQVMDYYGFDGYFFNQESYGCGPQEGKLIEEMMRYMHRMRPDMLICWYDSMLPGGSVSYQDSVSDANKQFMKPDEDGVVPVDQFFMNYNWYSGQVNATVRATNSINRSPFDAFAGVNVQENCMKSAFRDEVLVDEDGRMKISLALYCPNSTLGLSPDGEAFHKIEQQFYTNSKGDPRDHSVNLSSSAWAGMSRFFADKTPITKAPFVTNFNSGHGKGYYLDGQLSRDKVWSYQSIQDVMPTWTWIIDSTGTDKNLNGSYEFDTVYNGGSSIAFEGSLKDASGKHNVMLYSTNVKITSGMTMELASILQNGTPDVNVVLYLDDGNATSYETCEKALLKTSTGSEWTNDSWKLDAYAGKTLKAIGFEMAANGTAVDTFKLILGHLALLDRTRLDTDAVSNFRLEDILYRDAYRAEVRLSWETVSGASSYLISQVMADGSRKVLMETPNNYFYLPSLVREAGQTDVKLEVAGINRNGKLSPNATELVINWKYQDGDTDDTTPVVFNNLCLNAKVVDVSRQNNGEPASKALDGTSENNSKWCATNASSGYMVIDLGEPKTVNRWRVEHAEAGGEDSKMNTYAFSLQYFDESSQRFKTVKEFRNNRKAITDVLLESPVTAQKWKLDITDSGHSPWGAIRIYEWQMFGEKALPAPENVPMENATCVNNAGSNDTFKLINAPYGSKIRVYKGSEDVVLGEQDVDENYSVNMTFDLGTAEAGKVRYCVVKDGTESPKLSAEFFAENSISEEAKDVSFEKFSQPGSNTAYSYDGKEVYTKMTVNGLAEGDIVRVYGNGTNKNPTFTSAPVPAGSTSAVVNGLAVSVEGQDVTISVQRKGMAESAKYAVTSPAFEAATATVQIFAKNNKGETLTGVKFDLYNNGGVAAQASTTSDSGAVVSVPLGTYSIRCTSVPNGYILPSKNIDKIVSIEGWNYPITFSIDGEAIVEPTEPEPTEPQPTDPETTDPVAPVDPDLEALKETVLAAQAAAEKAQKAAEEAQAKAEAAQAAAEAAEASSAADKTAAETARAKAEEAQAQADAAKAAAEKAKATAEEAARAAEASNLAAAEEARKAAESASAAAAEANKAADSASKAAVAQQGAQTAQAAAEKAQQVAEQAKKDAQDAADAAQKAADSSATDKEAAEKAKVEAAAAQEAAENAQKSAEEALAAAEAAKNAAEASDAAAAAAAGEAAKSAQQAAESYQQIANMKRDMAKYLEDAQAAKEAAEKAQQAAEKAELACAKYYALFTLTNYADKADYRAAQHQALADAIEAGIDAINAAENVADVEAALADAQKVIDEIPTAAELEIPFIDVPEGSWYDDPIRYCYYKGLFSGVTDTEFAPSGSMTRAQMIAVLYRLAGRPDTNGMTHPFKDVPENAYYAKAVLWAYNNKVLSGTSADTFSPDKAVTRAQVAMFLYRNANSPEVEEDVLSTFPDHDQVSPKAVKALNWAIANHILYGVQSDGTTVIAANQTSTRAQVAAFLYRYIMMPEAGK